MRKKLKEIGPFSGDQKPVRIGTYKRSLNYVMGDAPRVIVWSHWNGKWWGCYCHRKESASKAENAKEKSGQQELSWWGCNRG